MLRIKKEQMAALERAVEARFEDDMLAHARRFFPAACGGLGDPEARALLREILGRARSHGITTERASCLYLSAGLKLGSRFDEDPALAWAREILDDARVPSGAARVDRLADELGRRAHAAAWASATRPEEDRLHAEKNTWQRALGAARERPDTAPGAKQPCREQKRLRITPKETSYVVVLDARGKARRSFPVLKFQITEGSPGEIVDVQVARDAPALLFGGLGLQGAWDERLPPAERMKQLAFSSFTHAQEPIVLNGSGKASYEMPLAWWQDLARLPRRDFHTAQIHYRAVSAKGGGAAPTDWSTADGETAPSVPVRNNLVDFRVVDLGYTDEGGAVKPIRMELTVEEPETTDMYVFVQWMQGYQRRRRVDGSLYYPTGTTYDLGREANFPDFMIDAMHDNPRYHLGKWTVSPDGKTASAPDAPFQGRITDFPGKFVQYASSLDFETRVHLNFEVPDKVRVVRKDGAPPVYRVVAGDLPEPLPFLLDAAKWEVRVLQALDAQGAARITHPSTLPP